MPEVEGGDVVLVSANLKPIDELTAGNAAAKPQESNEGQEDID
jgi:hypothetical protein